MMRTLRRWGGPIAPNTSKEQGIMLAGGDPTRLYTRPDLPTAADGPHAYLWISLHGSKTDRFRMGYGFWSDPEHAGAGWIRFLERTVIPLCRDHGAIPIIVTPWGSDPDPVHGVPYPVAGPVWWGNEHGEARASIEHGFALLHSAKIPAIIYGGWCPVTSRVIDYGKGGTDGEPMTLRQSADEAEGFVWHTAIAGIVRHASAYIIDAGRDIQIGDPRHPGARLAAMLNAIDVEVMAEPLLRFDGTPNKRTSTLRAWRHADGSTAGVLTRNWRWRAAPEVERTKASDGAERGGARRVIRVLLTTGDDRTTGWTDVPRGFAGGRIDYAQHLIRTELAHVALAPVSGQIDGIKRIADDAAAIRDAMKQHGMSEDGGQNGGQDGGGTG